MNPDTLLRVRGLNVSFGTVRALRGVDVDLERGKIHALVGESGAGKSVTTRAILGLLPADRSIVEAEAIDFDEDSLLGKPESELRHIRGGEISMIFQEPARHLNPSLSIGQQIVEMIGVHRKETRAAARARAAGLLELVGLGGEGQGSRVLTSYPHELSGGMKQRAMIAMALSCDPKLLIADEPTTALDVTIQRQILDLLRSINHRLEMSVLFISHDLGVVHEIADSISVMYAGRIVETASGGSVFTHPQHPYTKLLLASIPDPERRSERLEAIPGTVPDPQAIPSGCAFHPRCPFAETVCVDSDPVSREVRPGHRVACHFSGHRPLEVRAFGGVL